jgi:Ca-activated chloride channel homolog
LAALRTASLIVIVVATTLSAQPSFRAMVDLVTVPVVVTAGDGTQVSDLGVADFHVWEDGVAQEVAVVSRDPRPLSLCILLDSSPSMAGREILATRAIDAILARLGDDDEAALLMFASTVKVALPWTRATDTRSFSWYGWRLALGTALIDALKDALALVESARNPLPVIVIVSDGAEITSGTPLAKLSASRRQSETRIYGIRTRGLPSKKAPSMSAAFTADRLPDLVGDSGGRVFRASDITTSETAAISLLDELRSQYILGYTPKKPWDGHYRRVKITATNPALVVRHREGYLAAPR